MVGNTYRSRRSNSPRTDRTSGASLAPSSGEALSGTRCLFALFRVSLPLPSSSVHATKRESSGPTITLRRPAWRAFPDIFRKDSARISITLSRRIFLCSTLFNESSTRLLPLSELLSPCSLPWWRTPSRTPVTRLAARTAQASSPRYPDRRNILIQSYVLGNARPGFGSRS